MYVLIKHRTERRKLNSLAMGTLRNESLGGNSKEKLVVAILICAFTVKTRKYYSK